MPAKRLRLNNRGKNMVWFAVGVMIIAVAFLGFSAYGDTSRSLGLQGEDQLVQGSINGIDDADNINGESEEGSFTENGEADNKGGTPEANGAGEQGDLSYGKGPEALPVSTGSDHPENDGSSAAGQGTLEGNTADNSQPDSYFSDALFIGDSRTKGLMLYAGIDDASYYTETGLTVSDVFSKEIVVTSDGKITVEQALRANSFGKVYIMLGINELGWVYPEKFIEKYEDIIDLLHETQPGAKIYIQSIFPVTAERSERDEVRNNERIASYNKMLVQMVMRKGGVYFLNVQDAVTDETGALAADSSTDGIHLNKTYCIKWADYLKSNKL